MRQKRYDKSFILNGAYKLVKKKGFSSLTARDIAKELYISTQPIYIEFKNMKALRDELLIYTFMDIQENYFNTNNTLEEFIKNVLSFINDDNELYLSLLSERAFLVQLANCLYELYCENSEIVQRFKNEEDRRFSFIMLVSMATAACYVGEKKPDEESDYLNRMNQLVKNDLFRSFFLFS